ncbi:MAG: hypothetical protein JSR64_13725 [Nitrospira sp.]|nr:hypothetical protein [Nitrospira sp.]
MDIIRQILESFSGTLPKNSETASAISRGAGPEEIAACATAEGLHALAGALFEACEEGGAGNVVLDSSELVEAALPERLREFRKQLPAGCETARLIDVEARLEEISAAAHRRELTSLATILFEAEQDQD